MLRVQIDAKLIRSIVLPNVMLMIPSAGANVSESFSVRRFVVRASNMTHDRQRPITAFRPNHFSDLSSSPSSRRHHARSRQSFPNTIIHKIVKISKFCKKKENFEDFESEGFSIKRHTE